MSRLLSLYPRAWQQRYRAELAEMLSERPPTVRDRFDLLRGALDAWIHPQVRKVSAMPDEPRPFHVEIVALAVAGAVLIGVAGLWMMWTSVGTFGYKENGGAIVAMVAGFGFVAATAIATVRRDRLESQMPAVMAVAMLVGAVLTALPWPILIVGFFLHVIATIGFGLRLMADGRRIGGLAVATAGLLLPNFNTEDERALITLPVGVLWIVAGIALARRSTRERAPKNRIVPLGAD